MKIPARAARLAGSSRNRKNVLIAWARDGRVPLAVLGVEEELLRN
ncbi:hypothetical protein ACNF49_30770 [Actinomadura sp. ATCC 39365]